MQCFKLSVILTFLCLYNVDSAEIKIRDELRALAQQLEEVKSLHLTDVQRLKMELDELKSRTEMQSTTNHERNEQVTLQWAMSSMKELRVEMKEISRSVNNSALLHQLHIMSNELKRALYETSDLVQLARTQETRIDKLDSEVGRLKYENQQMRADIVELESFIKKLSKEVQENQVRDLNMEGYNDVIDSPKRTETPNNRSHRHRHNKMVHVQISHLAQTQNQLDHYQQNLQTQILDVQRRIDRYEEPNWNLLSAKVDMLELETKVMRKDLRNTTQKVSDLDIMHSSMLELREDVENVENKVDKTIPEFRKEISKLDVNFAQLNAKSSYLKEDLENLRQSVKAIAVSISNTIDKAEIDRIYLKQINDSVSDLETRTKQHFYRLNDHILKSEASHNLSETEIPLPELIGEVKELEPVQREYEDLVKQLPKDCSSISGPAGTYLIHPGNAPIDAWCDNGTTLLQRRYNGSIEFNRKFVEYVRGFGEPSAEYWLGLETMHLLTADNCSAMRIDMTDIYGGGWYAQYDHFSVGSADTGYVLAVSGFKGNASDAFEYQNHMEFSAIDRDRDISNTHCAGNYEGGWWFSHCQHVNINGKYTLGLTWFDSARNEWIAVATSEMRMYRGPGCI